MKLVKLCLVVLVSCFAQSISAQDVTTATVESKPAKVKPGKPKPEKTYRIIDKTPRISKFTIFKNPKSDINLVEIQALNITGGSILIGRENPVLPPAEIQSIENVFGNYGTTRAVANSGRGIILTLQDVKFPYRARLTVSGQIAEFELMEPGNYKVSIGVNL